MGPWGCFVWVGVASQGSPRVRLHFHGVLAGGARREVPWRDPRPLTPPHSQVARGIHTRHRSLGAAGHPVSGDHPLCRLQRRVWMLPFLSDPEYSSELEELDGTRDLCPDFQTLAQEKVPRRLA